MPTNLRNFLISFLISALLFTVIATGGVHAIRGYLQRVEETPAPAPDTPEEPDEPSEPAVPASGTVLNLLLIGTDYAPSHLSYGGGRAKSADTILLVSFNTRAGSLVICPIPAKTMTKVDGNNMTLAQAYNEKGAGFVTDKVSMLVGFTIPYYVTVGVEGLAQIIDELGGFTYDVPYDMNYEDAEQGLFIHLAAGRQKLTGEQTLGLIRYNGNDDVDHTGAVRTALGAQVAYELLRQEATYTHKKNAAELYRKLSPLVETNFTLSDLSSYLSVIFGYGSLNFLPMEYPGAYTTRFFTPNIESATEMLAPYCS